MAQKKKKKKGILGLFSGKDKEKTPEEVKETSVDDEETKDSMPPVEEATSDVTESPPEPVEEVPAAVATAVPGRPEGAPDPKDCSSEHIHDGFHIYKLKGTNQKIKIPVEKPKE